MLLDALQKVVAGEDLARGDADAAMTLILAGRVSDVQIAGFLAALHAKGETVDELVGFATAMRRHAVEIYPPGHKPTNRMLVDTCGTGGDARGTFNISTTTAFVVAGAGVHVAKHGNRSISSKCGSADVLEALGVNIHLPPERVGAAIEQVGIGFLFAPALHTAMKHAMKARSELRLRTAFNLLGPLTNPAGASAQVLGVYERGATDLLAQALAQLGSARAFVVHGADGLDEISLSGETHVAELRDGAVKSYTVTPEDFGLRRAPLEAIAGGDARTNAEIVRGVLKGEGGPQREIVQANAAAALVAAGRATDFLDGVRIAAQSIDSSAAQGKLDALIAFSQDTK
ncbi:MAG: anthranilate phosphoribosyltransferase [Acidobacteria bacterium]|nr:anthranilate phosphoribosyltransferase [Acidobacteriota bacterium]